jgi:hypothetical protein
MADEQHEATLPEPRPQGIGATGERREQHDSRGDEKKIAAREAHTKTLMR